MSTENKVQIPYVRLGTSGLKVSRLILGCMYGNNEYSMRRPVSNISDMLTKLGSILLSEIPSYPYQKAIAHGELSTADVYSGGVSEEVLGKAIKEIGAPRESIIVLTKLFHPVIRPGSGAKVDPNGRGLSRKHIFEAVQASLKRLQLDYIDVLQRHRFDYDTPIAETMQALHDVVEKGWVRYIGMSSCWAYQFQAMQNYAINNKLTPFISMQNFHNAAYREEEREMMPTLKAYTNLHIPFSCSMSAVSLGPPLCRGFLSRPWNAEETVRVKTDANYKGRGHDKPDDSRKAINERVEEVAKKKRISMAQVALAWSLSNDFITAPIVGSTSLDNLKELIGALDVKLTPEEKAYIDEPYAPRSIVSPLMVLYYSLSLIVVRSLDMCKRHE
ncbi:aryl-alcohol dehydrogenase [Kwoniella mangroviensis CBS 10435]|uniref:Aryl-alcohol dehydrogenase n=1 Tax=Kwoniella mangroviensis CBS 10435 TaxID=1331196 RepID=A0A1B9IHZ8_9TREE|nr:aryl-alcohol dehydrogenase [Kwoniella mangroviensis CBS 10435]